MGTNHPAFSFQIQANPCAHLTLSRLPEWCVHQHHPPASEKTEILHGKKAAKVLKSMEGLFLSEWTLQSVISQRYIRKLWAGCY